MRQLIAGFHRDDVGDWVAELACGHGQHVRHRPPFQPREWVLEEVGRRARIGTPLECPLCDDDAPGDGSAPEQAGDPDGSEAACYAALVCPDCGAVMGDAHPEQPCGR